MIVELFRKIFGLDRPKVVEPKVGEEWCLNSDDSPWESSFHPPVRILDVKGGWVRYRMNSLFPDERLPFENFVRIYHNVN